jgi:Fic-DOC domain mobile mystery protein B
LLAAVVMDFVYAAGQTPLNPDEAGGLKPQHITTHAQLNEWEQHNIVAGQRWGFRAARRRKVLEEAFIRELHKRMFDQTWVWAGTFRTTDKTIGRPWEQIGMRLNQLLANVEWQIANQAGAPDAIAVQFHRELVWIHPFPNGNGRHARLATDILIEQLGNKRFSWGANADLVAQGNTRTRYIEALRAADQGNYQPLLHFARS